MANIRRIMILTGVVVSVAALSAATNADESGKQDGGTITKESVLAWIDDYRKKQVLFHDDDIARLRKEIADDTPEEAAKWWAKSADIREVLDSEQWKETREWLREFLKVQAIYSDEQIAIFQNEAEETAKESPKDFKKILADIEDKRARLKQGSANAKALREDQLAVVQAFRKEQADSRLAANRDRAAEFDTVNPTPTTPRAPRYSQPPLVDSLDVARWGIMRGFWRR